MRITFLIGNGFDLRMGMKTRFADMYEGYIVQPSASDCIRRFKEMMRADAPEYKTWGDFEVAMAQYAPYFTAEEELIVCVRDFKDYIGSHLTKEQTSFLKYLKERMGYVACAREMAHSLHNFYRGQTPNVINAIEALGELERATFQFITFNYTTVLDQMLFYHDDIYKIAGREKPVHIHGSLDTDIVLGLDNINQFGELPFVLTKRGERAFVKPLFNLQFDKARIAAAERIIETSDLICIYGMSMGPSDAMWVRKIYEWIIADTDHHLIFFKHLDQRFSAWRRDEMMDEEDSQREKLLKRLCDSEKLEKIEDQVHVPIGYDIFNFRNAIDTDAEARGEKSPATMGSMKVFG